MTFSARSCFDTCITSGDRLIVYFSFCNGDDERAWEMCVTRFHSTGTAKMLKMSLLLSQHHTPDVTGVSGSVPFSPRVLVVGNQSQMAHEKPKRRDTPSGIAGGSSQ